MQRFDRAQEERRCPGRRQRRRDLLTDDSGLADAGDHDATGELVDGACEDAERLAEAAGLREHGAAFELEDPAGALEDLR